MAKTGKSFDLKIEQKIMPTYENYTSTISDEDGNPVTYAELTASDSTTEPIIIWDPSAGEQEKPRPEEPVTKPEEPVTKPEDPPIATDSDADEKPIATDSNAEEKPDDDKPSSGGSSSGKQLFRKPFRPCIHNSLQAGKSRIFCGHSRRRDMEMG